MPDSREKLIDFTAVRSLIRMEDVLALLSWEPSSSRGCQLRGPCPLPSCPSSSRRTFSVHLEKQCWRCFSCDRSGNHLDLWSHATGLDLYHAAIALCHQTGKPVPRRNPLSSPSTKAIKTDSTGPQ